MKMNKGGKILGYSVMLLLLGLCSSRPTSRAFGQSPTYKFDRDKPDTAATKLFVAAGTTKLHYVDSGSGRAVVMIHGNAGDLQDFEFGTLDLVARNYRTLAFDLPGHGLSKMPRKAKGTVQEQAMILHQALTALAIKDPILVGHSWGGAVALAYAVLYPHEISALVLLAPAAYSDHRHDAPASFLLRIPLLSDFCLAVLKPIGGRRLIKNGLKNAFAPDPVPAAYFEAVAPVWLGRQQMKAFIKNDIMVDESLQKLSPLYPNIHAPVIIVTGDSDLMVSPEQNAFSLHKAIARSEIIVIPKAGHEIPQTHPEAVLRAIDRARLMSDML
jgi:pimeloyl-ACP methyl ester carboxylesterase